MRLLLDTHTLIWSIDALPQLSLEAARLSADRSNFLIASAFSLWELAIKVSIGKLTLSSSLPETIERIRSHRISWLPINHAHLLQLAELPLHHRDPFDRLLAAQAIVEGATLLSADPAFDNYGVTRCW